MRIKLAAVLTTVIILVTIISAYYFFESNESRSLPYKKNPPLVDINLAPSGQLNATQGGVISINVTLASLNINETTIPLSLVLQAYNNEPWDSSISQNELFSSTFTINPIVLKANETKASILTLHVAEGTPIGRYTFLVEMGNSQIHHLIGTTFDLVVAPSS